MSRTEAARLSDPALSLPLPRGCRKAWALLVRDVEREFGNRAFEIGTPAVTNADIALRAEEFVSLVRKARGRRK